MGRARMTCTGARLLRALAAVAFGLTLVMSAAAQDTVGWRTDGTGEYPDASLVTTWSAEENVIWATPMPGSSNSLPVVVGERVFVSSDPAELLCVDAASGEILWQASNAPADIAAADEVADIEEKTDEYNRLRGELGGVNRDLRSVRGQLQDDQDNEEFKEQFQQLRERQQQLQQQITPLEQTWYVRPPAHQYNGYSSPTPVTDGQHVWAVYGTGIACCYDADGNRVWARFIEKPPNAWGASASPVLAGDRLIVHLDAMRALDPLTGEELWAQPEAEWSWGTSWVEGIGGETIILSPAGDAVRAEDGQVLASGLGKTRWGSGPVVQDGVLYSIGNQGGEYISRALALPDAAGETFEAEELWTAEPHKERHYASPVIHEGLVYTIARYNTLSCLDAETGEIIYETKLDLGKGDVFASVVRAGDLLMVTHENGTTVVFEPGREFVEVARNQLGDMVRSTPVFDGDRMYVRGYEQLHCIGPGG